MKILNFDKKVLNFNKKKNESNYLKPFRISIQSELDFFFISSDFTFAIITNNCTFIISILAFLSSLL